MSMTAPSQCPFCGGPLKVTNGGTNWYCVKMCKRGKGKSKAGARAGEPSTSGTVDGNDPARASTPTTTTGPTWQSDCGRVQLYCADCLAAMPEMPADSFDSLVTDPPYGLGFMGKDWDHGVPGVAFWQAALRVAKPGAHLLAFGGDRTHHRLMVAIEDAGWEIRTCVYWAFGSGFPKSLDVSKAIDKAAGAERETLSTRYRTTHKNGTVLGWSGGDDTGECKTTAAARQWDGWGTALKPAVEIIVVARKPLSEPTVAANVLKWGTGGLNVDGCRIGTESTMVTRRQTGAMMGPNGIYGKSEGVKDTGSESGRFPSTLLLDGSEQVEGMFPQTASGARKGGDPYKSGRFHGQKGALGLKAGGSCEGDSGSAARFFKSCPDDNAEDQQARRLIYCAKAGKQDRDEGCEELDAKRRDFVTMGTQTDAGIRGRGRNPENQNAPVRNHHPTVKPTALMRYLCRLVTPPNGLVLDLFTGSGSTGKAAVAEGFRFVGIELDADYCEIARRRIQHELAQGKLSFTEASK